MLLNYDAVATNAMNRMGTFDHRLTRAARLAKAIDAAIQGQGVKPSDAMRTRVREALARHREAEEARKQAEKHRASEAKALADKISP